MKKIIIISTVVVVGVVGFLLYQSKEPSDTTDTINTSSDITNDDTNIDTNTSMVTKTNYDGYVATLLDQVYGAGSSASATIKGKPLDPTKIDWEKYVDDTTPGDFGTYTLNPDTKDMTSKDFEDIVADGRIEIVNASNDNIYHTAMKIAKEYSDGYYIPGIEFWKWLVENPSKAPAELKDGLHYFFLGTLIRRGGEHIGDWATVYLSTKTDKVSLGVHLKWIGDVVDANNRAVVIKK